MIKDFKFPHDMLPPDDPSHGALHLIEDTINEVPTRRGRRRLVEAVQQSFEDRNAQMPPDLQGPIGTIFARPLQPNVPTALFDSVIGDHREHAAKILSGLTPARRDRVMNALDNYGLATSPIAKEIYNKELTQLVIEQIDDDNSEARRCTARAEIAAIAGNIILQKVSESCFHKAVTAWREGKTILPSVHADLPQEVRDCLGHGANSGIFLIQHDWAAAFEKAQDFDSNEPIALPYPESVFETRLSGHRVCLSIAGAGKDSVIALLNIETSVGWALGAAYNIGSGNAWTPVFDTKDLCRPIMNMLRQQVRAICVALEAEVATTETVRAPHKLNQQRERKGKLPLYDYHVINLAHRTRTAPRLAEDGGAMGVEQAHRRLHFVRGHWRHYPEGKTYIKWHLRGDPDLGFIDKHYRL